MSSHIRSKKENRILNIVCAVLGMMVFYALLLVRIYFLIQQEFGYIMQDDSKLSQTIEQYKEYILGICVFAIILYIVWWLLASTSHDISRFFEENTFLFVLTFLFALVACAILGGTMGKQVCDEFGNMYYLNYSYSICGGFAFMLFSVPPKNVNLVMMFGPKAVRWGLAIISFIVTIGLVWE